MYDTRTYDTTNSAIRNRIPGHIQQQMTSGTPVVIGNKTYYPSNGQLITRDGTKVTVITDGRAGNDLTNKRESLEFSRNVQRSMMEEKLLVGKEAVLKRIDAEIQYIKEKKQKDPKQASIYDIMIAHRERNRIEQSTKIDTKAAKSQSKIDAYNTVLDLSR